MDLWLKHGSNTAVNKKKLKKKKKAKTWPTKYRQYQIGPLYIGFYFSTKYLKVGSLLKKV